MNFIVFEVGQHANETTPFLMATPVNQSNGLAHAVLLHIVEQIYFLTKYQLSGD